MRKKLLKKENLHDENLVTIALDALLLFPKVLTPAKIDANYAEGVLFISLPKRKEALPQPKKLISIR